MAQSLAISLYLALFLSGLSIYFCLKFIQQKQAGFLIGARNASFAMALALFFAISSLIKAFLDDDFSLKVVAQHSSSTLPFFYKFSALWGGQEGSLLLWAFVLSLYIAALSLFVFRKAPQLFAYVLPVAQGVAFFFLFMLCYISPPFAQLAFPPQEGAGLNPLLQNPFMVIHPPLLYIGYVGMTIPYAFCMGALLMGARDNRWIVLSRKFTLFAWLFLGMGILMGAQWAYLELGWGGYWGWDPVENASLMPWLLSTAFLHSVMITEYRQILKAWNIILIIFSFSLSIFGTFLTRSGVLSSVHSFAQSDLGPFFFGFLSLVLLFSFSLLLIRWQAIREDERPLESYISKEASFLFNNLVLAGLCFAVFWGTVFPLISEAVLGKKISVSAPYFNQVAVPLFLVLLFLTGVGPLIAWRKASVRNLKKNFAFPLAVGLATGIVLALAGIRHAVALLSFSLCAFVLTTIIQEFYSGVRARRKVKGESFPKAFFRLFARNPRRFGGYIVHLGIVLMFIAATGEGAFKKTKEVSLSPGQSTKFLDYTITFEGLKEEAKPEKEILRAKLKVEEDGSLLGELLPEKNFHPNAEQPMTEVDIMSSFKGDLYAILLGPKKNSSEALFKFYYNPLISWLWLGGIVMFLGGLITLLPMARSKTVPFSESARIATK